MEMYMARNKQRTDWAFGSENIKNGFFTLEQILDMPSSEFEDFYVPEKQVLANGIFLKTFNHRHTITEFYDIRFVWFNMNGELDPSSLYQYYEIPKTPMIMWRIIIDKHSTGYMTPSYYVRTDKITMGLQVGRDRDSMDKSITKYIFDNEVEMFNSNPDLLRKMAQRIHEISWSNY